MNGRRGFYNIAIGFSSQAIIIVLGIIVPRLFLTTYGSEYNGLLNTIGQAFAYLVLLEAGVGGASIQALYAAIAKSDIKGISAIVSATGYYYKKTGFYYAIAVIVLALVFPIVTDSSIPPYTIIILILLAGIPGVIRYIYQGKYTVLLLAEGKQYIVTSVNTFIHMLVIACKIILLIVECNIVIFQACSSIVNLLSILIIYVYARRNYQWIDYSAAPDFKATEQKHAVLVGQVSDLVFRNSSTLIIAFFCDLKTASVYAIFGMLFSMVQMALNTIGQSLAHIMGQTFNSNKELFIKYHDIYETFRLPFIFSLYLTSIIYIIPFLRLYTAGITDANYLDYGVAALFVCIGLLSGARACESDLICYAQHFRKTQWRCVAEATINVCAALILTPIWGIHGALISTIIALLYRSNDVIIYANLKILNRLPWRTYKRLMVNSTAFISFLWIFNNIPLSLDSYLSIIAYAALTCFVSLTIFWIIAALTDRECSLYLFHTIKHKIFR